MIDYNTSFIVKYKSIEDELNVSSSSSKDDIETIIDELYRHEILSVFKTDDIYEDKISTTLEQLWNKMSPYTPFRELFETYKEKCMNPGMDNLLVFSALFSYFTFDIIHPCICDFLKTQSILPEHLESFTKYLDSYQLLENQLLEKVEQNQEKRGEEEEEVEEGEKEEEKEEGEEEEEEEGEKGEDECTL